MLIGVSGKIGSGKDETGRIIQYLTHVDSNTDSTTYDDWCNMLHTNMRTFKIKKFADKLKDIVCLMLGCTRKQLEDRDFKEKELGEEWKIKNNNWIGEAELLKGLALSELTLEEVLENGEYEKIDGGKGRPSDKNFYRATYADKTLTPRRILQLLGTEAGREIIHPNIWVNALMSEYKAKDSRWNDKVVGNYPNWVITDMRFPNELEAVKSKGGITIRIERPNERETDASERALHPSETALDNAKFDYVVYNTGTIEDLIKKIKDILIKEEII